MAFKKKKKKEKEPANQKKSGNQNVHLGGIWIIFSHKMNNFLALYVYKVVFSKYVTVKTDVMKRTSGSDDSRAKHYGTATPPIFILYY